MLSVDACVDKIHKLVCVLCVFRYGKLNVGDQILVCDGVNLINVTHNEAAQALKKAMDMDSVRD